MRWIELRAGNHGHRIGERGPEIRLVVRDEHRPTIVARTPGLVDFIVAARAASGGVDIRIGTDIAPIQKPCVRVDRDAIRVAVTHRVNLGARFRRARRKEVSDRDGPAVTDAGIRENERFIRSLRMQRLQQAEAGMIAASYGLHASFTLSPGTLDRCAAGGDVGRVPAWDAYQETRL